MQATFWSLNSSTRALFPTSMIMGGRVHMILFIGGSLTFDSESHSDINGGAARFIFLQWVIPLGCEQFKSFWVYSRHTIIHPKLVGFSGTPNNETPYPYYSHTTPIRIPGITLDQILPFWECISTIFFFGPRRSEFWIQSMKWML